ncbi:hypothetical protein FEM48_Zijuj07G0034400 [Ziziphus jujuba var. spinosa]|uniref:NADP-dependent oxidoreductase domain-containing protein n=1 Tax=Ziziphus jujuba var. spinosa TaxID=714518 RepID=A0A978V267_ZIZJJ|nr:hypothetical protein FEM48_Zijuj07G0034400 [Ziziphus jujuba var. spinosa]
MAQVRRIKLGSQGLEVSAQGLGCMGMSAAYGPPKPESDMISLIHHAINSGVTFLDTSDLYGPFINEILLGKVGELKKLVEEGKIKYIGLSEASAATIRRAHAVHPITAVQLEWSLWSRDVEEDIIPTCRELGIGIVAYSPLVLNYNISAFKHKALAKGMPIKFIILMQDSARLCKSTAIECIYPARKGCTPSQLALAWVHHEGNDVCPIPGTTKIENFNQNIGALSVKLTPEEKAELEAFASMDNVKGDRYATGVPTYKQADTPPFSSWKAT